jgi:MFS family permease
MVPMSDAPRRFAALRNRSCATYLVGAALMMMADNIEHVITYWMLWQQFHSPALAGFEVISHWLPFLLLSVPFGQLADRYDCRRIIQAGGLLFALVSIAWGVLFATHTVTIGAACVLLVLHGTAGALWGPAEQLMLHDFVDRSELPSAVRLNATFRSLGILAGPVVGALLLFGFGAQTGIIVNALFYAPLIVFLFITRFTGHTREVGVRRPPGGFREAFRTLRLVRTDRTLVSMLVLAGLGSFFIGASLLTTMPAFAERLGAGTSSGLAYGALLFATGAGGVVGGVLLEATSRIPPTVGAAVTSTLAYGGSILIFALTGWYWLALLLLFIGGMANLASMSISQTVVQLLAPPAERGRVVGLYGVSANGLRMGSGLTVGLVGQVVGVAPALAWSSGVLLAGTLIAGGIAERSRRRLAR